MEPGMDVTLIVKVQQFEDKRIEAKATWKVKELKGKLSEIYLTVSKNWKEIASLLLS
jgi:phosphopantetheine adenylyltransferase